MVNNKINSSASVIDCSSVEKIELALGDTHEIIVEGEKTFIIRKKPKYPKTYKECCKIMKIHSSYELFGQATTQGEIINCAYTQSLLKKINIFHKLYICRDAYWKLYGEQMGLGKPWEPDWKDDSDKYFICYLKDELWVSNIRDCNRFLVFPTEEMRDAFLENFKELIEQCKELL